MSGRTTSAYGYSDHHCPHRAAPSRNHSQTTSSSYSTSYFSSAKTNPSRPVTTRARWPPSPFAEDERISLRREKDPPRPVSEVNVRNRGTWDQEPIVIEVSPVPQPQEQARNKSTHGSASGLGQNEPRDTRRYRPEPARLNTAPLPEMSRRSSPYTFSASTSSTTPSSSTSKTSYSNATVESPVAMTPAPNVDLRQSRPAARREPLYGGRRPAPHSIPNESIVSQSSANASNSYVAPRECSRDSAPFDLRDVTEPVRPAEIRADVQRRPAPAQIVTLVREESGQSPGLSSRKSSHERLSIHSSPRISIDDLVGYPPSPPRSPRSSMDRSQDLADRRHSRLSSRSNSPVPMSGMPIITPVVAGTAFVGSWSPMTDPHQSYGQLPPVPRPLSSGYPSVHRAESLPYPVNGFSAAMPEETHHQFLHEEPRTIPTSAPRISRPLPYPDRPEIPPTLPVRSILPALSSIAPPQAQDLPICPRAEYVAGHTDWRTIDQCPGFDICPTCYHDVFEPTFYSNFFSPVSPRSRPLDTKIRCDFSNPWIRQAWLLIRRRRTPNLNLVKEMFQHLDQSRLCPDAEKEPRHWFTVLDDTTGQPLRYFHVCWTDTKCVEILLPRLRNFWVPYPSRPTSSLQQAPDTQPRLCSFRMSSSRFVLFMDSLIRAHDAVPGTEPIRVSGMAPFVQLVRRKVGMPEECRKDALLHHEKWYFIPGLPELTVCYDCHDEVIVPLLEQGAEIARQFNRSARYLPSADDRSARDSVSSFTENTAKASCYLYSPRMRRIMARAVRHNDLEYLRRKAVERKRKETELQRAALGQGMRIKEINESIENYEKRPGSERIIRQLKDQRRDHNEMIATYHDEWQRYE